MTRQPILGGHPAGEPADRALRLRSERLQEHRRIRGGGQGQAGAMTYGSGGVGNATHLNAERFMLSAGFQAVARAVQRFTGGAHRSAGADESIFSFSTLLPALAAAARWKAESAGGEQLWRAPPLCQMFRPRQKPAFRTPTTISGRACWCRRVHRSRHRRDPVSRKSQKRSSCPTCRRNPLRSAPIRCR